MHLLISHCAPLSEPGQPALAALQQTALPNLSRLLTSLRPGPIDSGDEWSLSPPHERVLAASLGWQGGDGSWPWAARDLAHAQPLSDDLPGSLAWGRLTPVHWLMGRDHLTTLPPSVLDIQPEESKALFQAAAGLFESDGWRLHWQAPDRWYAAHESLADLPTASLDRVVGRNPDAWMPDHPQARMIKRLQNEVQMLWYGHPVNEAREARRQPTINTLWLSGCGRHRAEQGSPPDICDALREPLWQEDWPRWLQTWQQLDQTVLEAARRELESGRPLTLTLAGERHARSWTSAGRSAWQRLSSMWRQAEPAQILGTL